MMRMDGLAEGSPAGQPTGASAGSRQLPIRAEDWLLAAWMAILAPWLIGLRPSSGGLFDGARPTNGLLALVGIVGAVACLASRRPEVDDSSGGTGIGLPATAALGPFVGGLLLVTLSTIAALGLAPDAVSALAAALAAVAIVVRLAIRPLPVIARRALVTPYILVSGGLFWTAIDGVTAGGAVTSAIRATVASGGLHLLAIVAFLVAFSAVFYAMLVYAPRQVADRDGSAFAWLVRYALFVTSVALGAGWPSLLG